MAKILLDNPEYVLVSLGKYNDPVKVFQNLIATGVVYGSTHIIMTTDDFMNLLSFSLPAPDDLAQVDAGLN